MSAALIEKIQASIGPEQAGKYVTPYHLNYRPEPWQEFTQASDNPFKPVVEQIHAQVLATPDLWTPEAIRSGLIASNAAYTTGYMQCVFAGKALPQILEQSGLLSRFTRTTPVLDIEQVVIGEFDALLDNDKSAPYRKTPFSASLRDWSGKKPLQITPSERYLVWSFTVESFPLYTLTDMRARKSEDPTRLMIRIVYRDQSNNIAYNDEVRKSFAALPQVF